MGIQVQETRRTGQVRQGWGMEGRVARAAGRGRGASQSGKQPPDTQKRLVSRGGAGRASARRGLYARGCAQARAGAG